MRWVVCALVAFGFAPHAFAADLPDFDVLRGSQYVGPATFDRWSGLYGGGQFSFSNTSMDFSGATQQLVAYSLRDLALEEDAAPSQWPVLGKTSQDAEGYGGFIGYNTQWQDLVVGIEANYTHTSISASAPVSPIGRVVAAGGNTYSVNLTGTGNLDLTDYGSLRARAGWVLGNFLPYGFVGGVIGRGDYNVTSLVYGQENPSSPPTIPCNLTIAPSCVDYSFANSASQSTTVLYGFSVGGGLDWAITQHLFMRGEFEYIRFAQVQDIVVSVISARVGAGLKF